MNDKMNNLPRRYRPGLWAGLINIGWSFLLILLWPISYLFRQLERMRSDV